ncbi:metalloregulator ArsR/SmtB family transcription factor, partial [Methanothrix sp.]|uniref:metalloregulator ArsR/SmtB family transcription factor n=1 Tax=Methanothrix sp. TaxID=90426 RepID=UPI0023530EE0
MAQKNVSELRLKILSALSDPTRLELLEYLSGGERCVCEILPAFSRSQSTISKHLNILFEADILDRRIDGKKTLYSIKDPQVFELVRLVAALEAGLATLLEYLSAHVLTCLVPAFFIAGAIAALLNKDTVLKYFGADAPKWLCYSVASTSGTILAVCSCTILPMFAGIEKRGAGIGPATAFLFSGPAINLMAIILTARVLGLDLGVARAVAAVFMAVVIGLIMAAIFQRHDPSCKNDAAPSSFDVDPDPDQMSRPKYITGTFMAVLVAILLVATSSAIELLPKAIIVGALIAV